MTDDPTRSLCPADADALDALLAHRAADADTGPLPPDSAERVAALRRLFAVLDTDAPGADPAEAVDAEAQALVEQTVAAVAAARQRERFAEQIEMLRQPKMGLGFSWQRGLAAAAAFLLAVGLLFPTLDHQRRDAQRVAGMANLGRAGIGLSSYALANNGILPKRAATPGAAWWNVGHGPDEHGHVQSNSAHLFQLVRDEYVTVDALGSPANPHAPGVDQLTAKHHDFERPEQISFSYQNQFTPYAIRLDNHARMVVLADKNPLIVVKNGKFAFDSTKAANACAGMYGKPGQNMLFTHGTVAWSDAPVIKNGTTGQLDNLYTAEGVATYTGTELPTHEGDVQLVP
ncbi:MAG: hypothetical protein AAFY08_03475 [Planctomycetota bacterium]